MAKTYVIPWCASMSAIEHCFEDEILSDVQMKTINKGSTSV